MKAGYEGRGQHKLEKSYDCRNKSLPTSLTTSFVEGIQKPKKKEIKLGLIGRGDAVNVYTVKSLLSRH